MRLPARLFFAAAPNTAMLFASVPPEVKNISSGAADIAEATERLASLSFCAASFPFAWVELGLPQNRSIISFAAAIASGQGLVVALLSKYISCDRKSTSLNLQLYQYIVA